MGTHSVEACSDLDSTCRTATTRLALVAPKRTSGSSYTPLYSRIIYGAVWIVRCLPRRKVMVQRVKGSKTPPTPDLRRGPGAKMMMLALPAGDQRERLPIWYKRKSRGKAVVRFPDALILNIYPSAGCFLRLVLRIVEVKIWGSGFLVTVTVNRRPDKHAARTTAESRSYRNHEEFQSRATVRLSIRACFQTNTQRMAYNHGR